ncbi:MAG: hypothetical protein JHC73_20435 [Dolichospermum sp.]|nr:hypothetical protein [Dolichospermum sp.]
MAFNQIIKGTLLPKVPLKTLFEEDTSSGNTESKGLVAPSRLPDTAQYIGANTPYIKIAGQIVTDIQTLTIDETGFIPTISLTFIDGLGEFAGDYFPKTNLIMNVYLKSGSEKLKPVRCDFLITSVKSIAQKYSGENKGVSIGTTYMIRGELFIPNIYNNISKSYSKLNSKDALKKICTDFGLGFAENENSPNDKMTWINTNMSTLNFIQDIVKHAYQDDDSFFMAFIDKYYYLNYIEVNKQLKVEDLDSTFLTTANALRSGINQKVKNDAVLKEIEEQTMINYLTTEMEFAGAPNYISELNLVSSQGDILKTQGYKKNIFYYDHLKSTKKPKEKFKDFYMAPLKSADRDQNQFLVPEEISLAENKIKKWMNIDYGNTHIHWQAARLLNSHNLNEIDKIKLKVTLNNINFQVVRGFTVPVYVSIQEAERILKSTQGLDDEPSKNANSADSLAKQTPDKQLSGHYYVSGAKYHYDSLHSTGLYTGAV